MTKEEKIQCFQKELNSLKDSKLKEFVEIILEGTGDWFYHDPASTSGKYHPKYALGDGGLMRHTRSVAYWVGELYRTELFDVNERQAELLTVAAILHDIRKHTADGGYIAKHARASYDLIIKMQEAHPDLISVDEAKYIADAVSTHMGIWGVKDGERKPTSDAEKLLHIADYCASRKEINMDFEQAKTEGPNLFTTPPKPVKPIVEEVKATVVAKPQVTENQSNTFVFTFGKYRGQNIEEIYNEHKDYLDWVISQKEFFDKELQNKIRDYVESRKK